MQALCCQMLGAEKVAYNKVYKLLFYLIPNLINVQLAWMTARQQKF